MPLIAKAKTGGNFELIPEDQHIARCVLVADIGTQDGPYGAKHQCIIGWEFPEVLHVFDEEKGEEPAMLSAFYTVSLSDKANLREMLESWRGRSFTPDELNGFDLANLLAVPCLVQVVHHQNNNGDTRAKVQGVTKLHKSMACPEQVVPSRLFSLNESGQEEFQAMPPWIQDKVREAAEYQEWVKRTARGEPQETVTVGAEQGAFSEDEVPF